MGLRKNIKKMFFKPEIYPEVITAYFHKLPTKVAVSWFRDSGFIVGQIVTDDGREFFTQGKNPGDFVVMVNDAVYTAYGVKEEYREAMSKSSKFYRPKREEWEKLNDGKVSKSEVNLEKKLVTA